MVRVSIVVREVGRLKPDYTTVPEDHLQFVGPMVRSRTDLGKITCVGLDLNRTKLMERRHEKLADLERRWSEIGMTQNVALKTTLQEALEEYAGDAATEYSACIAAFHSLLASEGT